MLSEINHLTRMAAVRDDAAHDVAHCASASIQPEATRNLTMRDAALCERDDLGIALCERPPLLIPFSAPRDGGVGIGRLHDQERAQLAQQSTGLGQIPHAPVVLGSPFGPVVGDDVNHSHAGSSLNGVDYGTVCTGNRDFDAAFRKVDAAFSIEEASKPADELLIGPCVHDAIIAQFVPLPMGRAVAKAVKRALGIELPVSQAA